MRRTVLAVVTAAVALGVVSGATAAPKPKTPKPVKLTQYFHGTQPVGEADTPPLVGGITQVMDATKPTGTSARSKGIANYVGGPNTQCAGNSFFPTWQGNLAGTVTEATVTFWAQGTGAPVNVQLFADIDALSCNDAFPKVGGSATVTIPAGAGGEVTAKIKLGKLAPKRSLMVQIAPIPSTAGLIVPPYVARVQYDATSALSRIDFTCQPNTGKTTC